MILFRKTDLVIGVVLALSLVGMLVAYGVHDVPYYVARVGLASGLAVGLAVWLTVILARPDYRSVLVAVFEILVGVPDTLHGATDAARRPWDEFRAEEKDDERDE